MNFQRVMKSAYEVKFFAMYLTNPRVMKSACEVEIFYMYLANPRVMNSQRVMKTVLV